MTGVPPPHDPTRFPIQHAFLHTAAHFCFPDPRFRLCVFASQRLTAVTHHAALSVLCLVPTMSRRSCPARVSSKPVPVDGPRSLNGRIPAFSRTRDWKPRCMKQTRARALQHDHQQECEFPPSPSLYIPSSVPPRGHPPPPSLLLSPTLTITLPPLRAVQCHCLRSAK